MDDADMSKHSGCLGHFVLQLRSYLFVVIGMLIILYVLYLLEVYFTKLCMLYK